uniref:Uncharacterized protein n=1 Tax=Avena sativa TaxID=4498 RepID=A0ACD6AQ96_AVESA
MSEAHGLVPCQLALIAALKLHAYLPPSINTSSSEPPVPSTNKALQLAYLTQKSELSAKKEGDTTMVSAKRLSQMIKKWQRVAAIGRKRLMGTAAKEVNECCSSVAVKGHCAMYTADGRRFEVPLVYLSTTIIGELLRMSQDEFGFTSDERITLPCDAPVMEYVMCLLRRNASEEVA